MKASNIAKGGLLTALGLILIYFSSAIPGNRLFLLTLASCISPVCILSTNLRTSFLVYIATCLLSLIFPINKMIAITYACTFGLYGFVKLYTERLRRLPLELFFKLMFFNISALVLYYVFSNLFIGSIKLKLPIYIIAIAAQILFLLYDYALTLFIYRFNSKFIKHQ